MKNALFATTAFVAAGLVAGAAQAADPVTASVSGYMHAGVGYVDRRGSDADIGVMRDGEIHFNARGTSDNGLTFRGRVELEAFTSGDQIDENWVEVGGAFGRVLEKAPPGELVENGHGSGGWEVGGSGFQR